MASFEESPFHPGEEEVQRRTGAFDVSLNLGKAWHSRIVSPAAAKFFAEQQLLYLASINKDGRLWASVVVGPLGFMRPQSSKIFLAEPVYRLPNDPAEYNEDGFLGTTAITLETRERVRLNGRVQSSTDHKLALYVDQCFGGCPKYIQARELEVVESQLEEVCRPRSDGSVNSGGCSFDEDQEALIARADTLFLASCYEGPLEGSKGVRGCDISHRGGSPGFVHIKDRSVLSFADYVGNFTFTTLGNIAADSRSSIIFLDFRSGDVLQLSGQCEILWEDRSLPGAQRLLQFSTEQWVHTRHAVPLGPAGPVSWSPYNPLPSCQYSKEVEQDRIRQLHNNYVDAEDSPYFIARCLEVVEESQNVRTFKFEGSEKNSTRRSGNAFCDPGQFASFDFPDVTDGEVLNRTWTVSSPQEEMKTSGTSSGVTFGVTIKKIGVVSGWMFANMQPGRTIHFRGVDGDFTLERRVPNPTPAGVLLIAGGIGITPMRVILHNCIAKDIPVTLLYSVQSVKDAVFLHDLQRVVEGSQLAELYVTVTGQTGQQSGSASVSPAGPVNGGPAIHNGDMRPKPASEASTTPQPSNGHVINGTGNPTLHGRITVAMIHEVCPDYKERDVFLCGPVGMMKAVENDLLEHQFQAQRLHQEVFTF